MAGRIFLGVLPVLALLLLMSFHSATPVTPQLWPDIICHSQYDHAKQQSFVVANSACKDGSKTRKQLEASYGINDIHGCILWRLKGLIIEENKTFEFVENQGLRKTLLTIFNGLYAKKLSTVENNQRKAFVEKLLEKSVDCKPLLNEFANVKKLPSKQWTEFYECINDAWKCPGPEHTYHKD